MARLGNYIHTPSVVFRNIINEFPFEFEYTPIGDYFLYMMLAEHGRLKFLEEKMAVYRFGVGLHSTHSTKNMLRVNFKLFALLLSYFDDSTIKQIFLERQLSVFEKFENSLLDEYKEAFVSYNVFFKALKATKKSKKFWSKFKNKLIYLYEQQL